MPENRRDDQHDATQDGSQDQRNRAAGKNGRRRPSFRSDQLEDRILLSSTWADADTGDAIAGPTDGADAFDGSEDADIASGLGGRDELFGNGGDDQLFGGDGDDLLSGGSGADVLDGNAGDDVVSGGDGGDTILASGGSDTLSGDSGDDTFVVDGAAAGDVITIDGGADHDRLDLTAYDSSSASFEDGAIEIDTGDGAFRIEYTDIEAVSFADGDVTFLDGDASGSVTDAGGADILVAGGRATSIDIEGTGSVSWSFDAETGSLTIDGVSGADADSTLRLDNLSDTAMPIESVTVETDLGGIVSDSDIGTLTIDHEANIGSVTVEGGSIETVSFTGGNVWSDPIEFNADIGTMQAQEFGTDITVNGDVGTVSIVDNVTNDATLRITGDVGTLDIGDNVWNNADIDVGGSVGTLSIGGYVDNGSTLTVSGDVGTLETGNDIRGDVTISGNAGTISVGDDLTDEATLTVQGNVGTLSINDQIRDGADVVIAGNAETVSIGRNIVSSSTLTIGGDLGTLSATHTDGDISVGGNAGTISIEGNGVDSDLKGSLTVGGDLTALEVGDDVEGAVSIGGDAGTLSAGDDFKGAGDITIGGNLGSITAGDLIAKDLSVGGNLGTYSAAHSTGNITVTGNAGTIQSIGSGSDADLTGDISIGGHLTTLSAADDTEGAISVGGNVGTMTAGDDFKGTGPITIGGNLGTMTAGDRIAVDVTTGGDIGTITAPTMTGDLTVGDDLSNFNVGQMDGDIYGSGDHNSINASASDETITTGGGNDSIRAGDGDDTIDAGTGNDWIQGGAGNDTIDGGDGRDTVNYSDVSDGGMNIDLESGTAVGTDQTDTLSNIENVQASNQDDTITGSDANNTIEGRGGDDVIDAGAGNDFVRGGTGDDVMDGGDGTDSLSYGDIGGGGVNVDMVAGTASGAGGNDTFSNFENVYGSNQDDTITGDAGNNMLDGERGDDVIDAGAGNDQVYGGLGDDTLDGGDGTDWVRYNDVSGGVNVDLNAGTASGAAGNDTLSNFENVFGSRGDDTLQGDAGSNTIQGHDGDDTIRGGLGDDVLDGDRGTDTVSYSDITGGGVNVNLADGTATGAGGNDTLRDFENAEGSNQDDTLTGDAGDNVLSGLDGDDTINAGAGNDTVYGGAGSDTIDGGDGNDYLRGDQGSDTLLGGAGNDTIDGGTGDDLIDGGAGDDTLIAGSGSDTLIGGEGTDTADYSRGSAPISVDLVGGTVESAAGNDTFSGVEAFRGTSHDDTFTLGAAVGGEHFTIDGGGGSNTLDLSNFSRTGITMTHAGDQIVVSLPGGETATIDFSNIDRVVLADADFDPSSSAPVATIGSGAMNEDGSFTTGELVDADGLQSGRAFITDIQQPEHGTLTVNDDGTFTYTPDPDFSGTDSFTYTVDDVTGSTTATVTLGVTPDADEPVLIVDAAAAGSEDTAIALDLSAALTDTDGSETLSVTISGVPEGATLSAGTDNGDGSWTLTPEQLDGLTVTPPADFSGEFDLSVSATATDLSISTVSFSDDALSGYGGSQDVSGTATVTDDGAGLSLSGNTWKDIPFPVTITADTVLELEFRSIGEAEIQGIGFDTDEGIDANRTFKLNGSQDWGTSPGDSYAGNGEWQTFRIPVGEFFTGDFDKLAFTHDNDAGGDATSFFRNIRVVNPADAEVSEPQTVTVSVAAVADDAVITAGDVSGTEDTAIALDLSASLADVDGSESLSVTISGVPDGATLSAGTDNGDGSWTLTPEQLDGLTVTPPTDFSGSFDLGITATTTDGSDTATVSDTFTVEVAGVADDAVVTAADAYGGEDSAIALDLSASLADVDGSESLSVTISGMPDGATLSAGTDNGDGSWTLTPEQLDGLTVTPPADFSGSFDLGITATTTDGSDTATVNDTFTVEVAAVADDAVITAGDVSGTEDTAIALDLSATIADTDGSESLSVTISGMPNGATLSAGTDNGDGSWTLTPEQLDGLTVTPPTNFSGSFDLGITATTTDGSDTATVSDTFTVDVAGVADAAAISVSDASGLEDTAIALDLSASLADTDGSESLSVTISGVPDGATLSAGTDNGDGSWTLTPEQLDGLTVTPAANSDADFVLAVSATTTEADSGDITTVVRQVNVDVAAVADEPIFSVGEGEDTITFRVSADEYRGFPTMRVMVNGEQVGSLISVTADHDAGEWQEITIRGDFGDNGARSVEVEFTNDAWGGTSDTDRNLYVDHISVNGERYDADESVYDRRSGSDIGGQSGMFWSGKLVFDTSDAPELALTVPEDTEIALPIHMNLGDADGSESVETVSVSGLPDGAVLSAGTDNGDGSWSVTPGELDGLSVTPPEGYSGTFDIRFHATSEETGGDSADAGVSIRVHVEAVADAASLSVADVSTLEDTAIALDLSASLADVDGSESLSVTISGVPDGATLSAGTDNGDGSWTLTPEQLDGLTVTPPTNFSGSFDLGITATTTDGSDTATVNDTFTVEVAGVADGTVLDAAAASGVEGSAIGLGITVDALDADGSESVTLTITNAPAGSTFSAGTENGDGTWTLMPDQLDGLTITPPQGYAGTFDLDITATTTDGGDSTTTSTSLTVEVLPAPVVEPEAADPDPISTDTRQPDVAGRTEPESEPTAEEPAEREQQLREAERVATEQIDEIEEAAGETERLAAAAMDWSDADDLQIMDARADVDGLIEFAEDATGSGEASLDVEMTEDRPADAEFDSTSQPERAFVRLDEPPTGVPHEAVSIPPETGAARSGSGSAEDASRGEAGVGSGNWQQQVAEGGDGTSSDRQSGALLATFWSLLRGVAGRNGSRKDED